MFEIDGYFIEIVFGDAQTEVRLYEDENDTEPLVYRTRSKDPYCFAALLATELDLITETEIIQLGELIDAHI